MSADRERAWRIRIGAEPRFYPRSLTVRNPAADCQVLGKTIRCPGMSSPSSNSAAQEILIAEDSPTQALLLQSILERHGFAVTAARNGRRALEALETRLPVLIISDIQMPEMDGYELCRGVKANAGSARYPGDVAHFALRAAGHHPRAGMRRG